MLESITSTLGTLTTFVMAIADVSLLVAAVSIFNVMMMSVTERIREIGILRSIGTQKNEVRKMFMYESAILGVIGAILGAVASLTIGWVVVLAMVGNTEYFLAPASLIYVPFAMIITCILSGLYPAWSASNLIRLRRYELNRIDEGSTKYCIGILKIYIISKKPWHIKIQE